MNDSTRILAHLVFVLSTCVVCGGDAVAQHAEPKVEMPQIDSNSSTEAVETKKAKADRPMLVPETEDFPALDVEAIEPNDINRRWEASSLPKTEIADQDLDAVLTPDEPSKSDSSLDELTKILEGKSPPPSGWPTSRVQIQHQRQIIKTDSSGNRQVVPVMEIHDIDPNKKDLSPKERHVLYAQLIEKQIRSTREKLLRTDDRVKRALMLNTLRQAYTNRFRVDTTYQNLKVTEIENRAKKLREDLTDRAASEENWVNAMTTLAEMRANGIDPMVSTDISLVPLTATDPRQFGQRPANVLHKVWTSNPQTAVGSYPEDTVDPRRQHEGFAFPPPTPDLPAEKLRSGPLPATKSRDNDVRSVNLADPLSRRVGSDRFTPQ